MMQAGRWPARSRGHGEWVSLARRPGVSPRESASVSSKAPPGSDRRLHTQNEHSNTLFYLAEISLP